MQMISMENQFELLAKHVEFLLDKVYELEQRIIKIEEDKKVGVNAEISADEIEQSKTSSLL